MKVLAVVLALAATALANPHSPPPPPPPPGCKPATYACAINPTTHVPGWKVCDVTGAWVYAGDCPPNTICKFLAINGSPYCIPK